MADSDSVKVTTIEGGSYARDGEDDKGLSSSSSAAGRAGETTAGDAGSDSREHDGHGAEASSSADAGGAQPSGSTDQQTVKYFEFVGDDGTVYGRSNLSIEGDTVSLHVSTADTIVPEEFYVETLNYVSLSCVALIVILVLVGAVLGGLASRTLYRSLEG